MYFDYYVSTTRVFQGGSSGPSAGEVFQDVVRSATLGSISPLVFNK